MAGVLGGCCWGDEKKMPSDEINIVALTTIALYMY
jgi:hypothetical protein